MTTQLSDQQLRPLGKALYGWLHETEDGRAIFERLQIDPERGLRELTNWLATHVSDAPPQLATYVSGGQVDNLINIAQAGVVQLPPAAPVDIQEVASRHAMLKRVHADWVEGVLEKSLHDAALIELGMEYQRDAVVYPWEMVMLGPDQSTEPLPPTTAITDVFDERGGQLLILGMPGSGKTTMLLELARTLIARAEANAALPMPVYFHLSLWSTKRLQLDAWLIEELNRRYSITKKTGQAWIEAGRVLPLLDGLDELPEPDRAACVEAINTFLTKKHGLNPLVVCCRLDDYQALQKMQVKLQLQAAVVLRPLTLEQMDAALAQAGPKLVAVRAMLAKDAALRDLARTPLMLNMIMLLYRSLPTAGAKLLYSPRRSLGVFRSLMSFECSRDLYFVYLSLVGLYLVGVLLYPRAWVLFYLWLGYFVPKGVPRSEECEGRTRLPRIRALDSRRCT